MRAHGMMNPAEGMAWREDDRAQQRATRAALSELVERNAEHLADAFYTALLDDQEARSFLSHEIVQTRLKTSLAAWLRDLFSDAALADREAYGQKQRKIGAIHARSKIPFRLVLMGAAVLRTRLVDLIRTSPGTFEERFARLAAAVEQIEQSLALMSDSQAAATETRARQDEAYRLFSLDQDVNLERESQRASLMQWAQATLFQLLDDVDAPALQQLASSPFGFWIRHRAGIMFEHAAELQSITEAMERIDGRILPRIAERDPAVRTGLFKELKTAVDEIAFLLGEMFQRLVAMENGRDPLTRVLNRRFLSSILSREIGYANTHRTTLSLLILDIDYFKRLNDTYGHQAGDQVLRQVAEVLMDSVRPSDFLFRYGGEEFLVVLVEVDRAGAAAIAERIRATIDGKEFKAGESKLHITVSAGVAQHAGHPDPEFLIERADDALYHAKHAGRNRVHSAA